MAPKILTNEKKKDISIHTDDDSVKSRINGDKGTINLKRKILKRRSYSFAEKKKIIEELDSLSKDQICEKYNLNRSSLHQWIKNSSKIKLCASGNYQGTLKKHRSVMYSQLEDMLYAWYSETHSPDTPVTGPMIKQKAKEIAKDLKILDFKASNGWLFGWKHRRITSPLTEPGENLSANQDSPVGCENDLIEVKEEKNFDWEQISNFDESPLQLESLPNSLQMSTAAGSSEFKTLDISVPKPFVYHVQLNRPKSLNALDRQMWMEIKECFNELGGNPDCRAVVLSGAGKFFNAGIDVSMLMNFAPKLAECQDVAQKCKMLKKEITMCQESLSAIELCPKPVVAAVHGGCIGGGMGIITAADIRYCTKDAWFQVKEVIMGLAADIGTLQRMPKIMGSDSLVRELVYTARKFSAAEAMQYGLVSRTYDDLESLLAGAVSIAEEISSRSPVAVQGSKLNLNYSRDHTTQEGLDHINMYNQAMLQSEDLITSVMAQATKSEEPPVFSKL